MKKILIILICSVCFAGCMNNEQKRQADTKVLNEKKVKAEKEFASRAYLIAKIYIKGKTKSLGNPEFPLTDYQSFSISPRIVEIRSYFEVESESGHPVRTHYKIKMEQTGNDWADVSSWEILDFTMY